MRSWRVIIRASSASSGGRGPPLRRHIQAPPTSRSASAIAGIAAAPLSGSSSCSTTWPVGASANRSKIDDGAAGDRRPACGARAAGWARAWGDGRGATFVSAFGATRGDRGLRPAPGPVTGRRASPEAARSRTGVDAVGVVEGGCTIGRARVSLPVVGSAELEDGVAGDTGPFGAFAAVASSSGPVGTDAAATGTRSPVGAAGPADSAAGAGGAGSGSRTAVVGSGTTMGVRAGSSRSGST